MRDHGILVRVLAGVVLILCAAGGALAQDGACSKLRSGDFGTDEVIELVSDCDLSPVEGERLGRVTIAGNERMTIKGDGNRIIGGVPDKDPPYQMSSFLLFHVKEGGRLELEDVHLYSVAILVDGELSAKRVTISGGRNGGVRVHGSAALECMLFEDMKSKPGTAIGSVITAWGSADGGSVLLRDVGFIDVVGGAGAVMSIDSASVVFECCRLNEAVYPRLLASLPVSLELATPSYTCRGLGAGRDVKHCTTPRPRKTPRPTKTPAPTMTPSPTPTPVCFHVVLAGENLYRLAMRYNVTVRDFSRTNHLLNDHRLDVGQSLLLPKAECKHLVRGKS